MMQSGERAMYDVSCEAISVSSEKIVYSVSITFGCIINIQIFLLF